MSPQHWISHQNKEETLRLLFFLCLKKQNKTMHWVVHANYKSRRWGSRGRKLRSECESQPCLQRMLGLGWDVPVSSCAKNSAGQEELYTFVSATVPFRGRRTRCLLAHGAVIQGRSPGVDRTRQFASATSEIGDSTWMEPTSACI